MDIKSCDIDITKLVMSKYLSIEHLERLRYVTSTDPVTAYRQVGISKCEAFRRHHGILKFHEIQDKELVNLIDFDSWKNIEEPPQIKKHLRFSHSLCNKVSIQYMLYFAKWNIKIGENITIKHENNSYKIFKSSLYAMISKYNMLQSCEFNKNPVLVFLEWIKCRSINIHDVLNDPESTYAKHDRYIKHVFTNVYVLNDTVQLDYCGNLLKNCARNTKKKECISSNIFVIISSSHPDVKEYIVEYSKTKDDIWFIREYGMKMNKRFPSDFSYADQENFLHFLNSMEI